MRISFRLAVVVFLAALPLSAQSNDIGVWLAMSQVGDTNVDQSRIKFDNGDGFAVSFNHFWSSNLSTELSATALTHDGEISIAGASPLFDVGSLDLIPITATVQLHFSKGALLSPYIGAGVSYVMAGDLESDDLRDIQIGTVEIDSKVGWVAQAGLNVGLTPRFAVAVDAKYIAYKPDSSAAGDPESLQLELDPVVVSAGVKFRW